MGDGVTVPPGVVIEGEVEGDVDGRFVDGRPVDGSDGSPVRESIGAGEGRPVRGSVEVDAGDPVRGSICGCVDGKPVRGSTVDRVPTGALGPRGALGETGEDGVVVDDGGNAGRAPGSVGNVEPVWASAGVAAKIAASASTVVRVIMIYLLSFRSGCR